MKTVTATMPAALHKKFEHFDTSFICLIVTFGVFLFFAKPAVTAGF